MNTLMTLHRRLLCCDAFLSDWGVALASLLSLGRLFSADFQDGTLEQMALSATPLPVLVGAKILAHWLLSGLPLALLALYQQALFGNPLATGYGGGVWQQFSTPFWVGFAGQIWSSGRGILWYAPPVLLFPAGLSSGVIVDATITSPTADIQLAYNEVAVPDLTGLTFVSV